MKIKNLQVHHYHHICYQPSRMRWLILGIVILSPICALLGDFNKARAVSRLADILSVILCPVFALLEFFNNIFHETLKLINAIFCSYMHLLDSMVRFCGWSGGLRAFWNAHPSCSTTMFFGLPILGAVVLFLILKRDYIMRPLIVLLYAWHYGLSTMVHTRTQWILMLSAVGLMLGLSWINRLIGVFLKKFVNWRNHSSSQFDNSWNFFKGFILNHS